MSKIIPNFGTVATGGSKITDFSSKKLTSVVGFNVANDEEKIGINYTENELKIVSEKIDNQPSPLKVRVKNGSLIQTLNANIDIDINFKLSKNPTQKEIEQKISELTKLLDLPVENKKEEIKEDEKQPKNIVNEVNDTMKSISASKIREIAEEKMAKVETKKINTQYIKKPENNKVLVNTNANQQKNAEIFRAQLQKQLQELKQKSIEQKLVKDETINLAKVKNITEYGSVLSNTAEESEKKFEEALKESLEKKTNKVFQSGLKRSSLHFPSENIYEVEKNTQPATQLKKDYLNKQNQQKQEGVQSYNNRSQSQASGVVEKNTEPKSSHVEKNTQPTDELKNKELQQWKPKPLTENVIQQAQLKYLQTVRTTNNQASQVTGKEQVKQKQTVATTAAVKSPVAPSVPAPITFRIQKAGIIPPNLLALAQEKTISPRVIAPIKQEIKQFVSPQIQKPIQQKNNANLIIKPSQKTTSKLEDEIKKQYKLRKRGNVVNKVLATFSVLILFGGIFSFSSGILSIDNVTKAVAGAYDSTQKVEVLELTNFQQWTLDKTKAVQTSEADFDDDGLTNYEEFLLQTNPASKNTCGKEKTDLENLVDFIDPATCEKMDLTSDLSTSKFNEIISKNEIRTKLISLEAGSGGNLEVTEKKQTTGVLETFGVENWADLNNINSSQIASEAELNTQKQEYLRLIKKIDNYITKYRSYEVYDREYDVPVHSAVYLQTSVQYGVDLKYVLAVARLESRFGTDRYVNSGELTRIGAHRNTYSIGLDDSGNNNTFPTWEQGVTAFGRWYKRFNDRGVSDCRKWRIYNPNGDYCEKVEKYANQIDAYLKE